MTLLLWLKKKIKNWEQAYFNMGRFYNRLVSPYENYKYSEEPCVWTFETYVSCIWCCTGRSWALFSVLDCFKYRAVNIAPCVVCDVKKNFVLNLANLLVICLTKLCWALKKQTLKKPHRTKDPTKMSKRLRYHSNKHRIRFTQCSA